MRVLSITVILALFTSGIFGQYNGQKSDFNAPTSIERGFAPLRSYFEKDSSPASTYQNQNYGSPNPNGGNYQNQNQPQNPQYIFVPQPQALTAEPPQYGSPQYGSPQVPDAISNYLAVIAQKYGQGSQNPQDSRQGPQAFVPPQMARPSPFQAPDQYSFVPPEQQQYQIPIQQYQQPPMQFNQPEFANIQPAAPPQQQYSNHLQYPQQQSVQYQGAEGQYPNQLPPITRNQNDLRGGDIYTDVAQNQRRPSPTKYLKGGPLVGNSYTELNDFGTSGLEDNNFGSFGGFGGFGGGKYGSFGGFEDSFDDFSNSQLNNFKFGPSKVKGSTKPSVPGGESSPRKSNRYSRGSIIGIRRPAHYILSSN